MSIGFQYREDLDCGASYAFQCTRVSILTSEPQSNSPGTEPGNASMRTEALEPHRKFDQ